MKGIVRKFSEWRNSRGVNPWYVERSSNQYIIFDSYSNVKKTFADIKFCSKEKIPENPVLYFDKTANFPRYKLNDTKFKRTIKIDKATNVVVGKVTINYYNTSNWLIISGDNNRIFALKDFECDKYREVYKLQQGQSILEHMKSSEWIENPDSLQIAYEGQITIVNEPTMIFYDNLKAGLYKNFILDSNLEKLINNELEEPTIDNILYIRSMLNSSDIKTQGLGLKLLCSYNINKIPTSVNYMIYHAFKKRRVMPDEWNSTGVKSLLNSIGYVNYDLLYSNSLDHMLANKEDAELFKILSIDEIKSSISNFMDNWFPKDRLDKLNVSFTYEIS